MTKFAARILPEMEAVLRHNGIDVKRVTEAAIHHSAKGGVTEIALTMLAIEPEEEK